MVSGHRLRKLRNTTAETRVAGQDYSQRLREKHKSMNKHTGWAEKQASDQKGGAAGTDSSDEDEDGEARDTGSSALTSLARNAGALNTCKTCNMGSLPVPAPD